jgi:hypothetical protein|tara:strand:+ start:4996 stop:5124 length:129 start_codon:yes stop_codon:yes gene_type:complete
MVKTVNTIGLDSIAKMLIGSNPIFDIKQKQYIAQWQCFSFGS